MGSKMGKVKDLTGLKVGRLTVIRQKSERGNQNQVLWECLCDCGKTTDVASGSLSSKNTTSCGCLRKESAQEMGKNRAIDLSGKRFTRLTVISLSPSRTKNDKLLWDCICDCGNKTVVSGGNLTSEAVKSCGCWRSDQISEKNTTHGLSKTPEYGIWNGMKKRCNTETDEHYQHYGARGISVCDRWSGSNGFENFISDVGKRPGTEYSIERRDNDGNYEPSNCYWATPEEQANNRRSNVYYDFRGSRLTAAQIARMFNVHPDSLSRNCKKFESVEDALAETIRKTRS